MILHACASVWHNVGISLHQYKKRYAMRNTEFTIENLASAISSESSLSALVEMIGDMGLEITDMAVSLK